MAFQFGTQGLWFRFINGALGLKCWDLRFMVIGFGVCLDKPVHRLKKSCCQMFWSLYLLGFWSLMLAFNALGLGFKYQT